MQHSSLSSYLAPKYWPTWLGLGVLRLVSFLPLPVVALIGQSIGMLAYWVMASRRRIAYLNISVCFPEYAAAECRLINRKHFRWIGQMLFATPMNMWVSRKRFDRFVQIRGREHYDAALAEQRNIILLVPHFVAIDIAGLALSRERNMISMYQYAKNALIDNISLRGRTRFGGTMFERKEPLRRVLREIRKGDPFFYLPDQDAGRKGIFVPFFHELASTTPALGKYASATQAVVIPCRPCIKPWGSGYDVVLGRAFDSFPTDDSNADTIKMNREIEKMVRTCPEQYFWVHKRFKTRPDGSRDKFYASI